MPELERQGTQVLAVVVDPVEQNAKVVEQLGLSFPILADTQRRVVDAYDLRHDAGPPGGMARPATFVIDRAGIVRWRNLAESYRVRPSAAAVVAAVAAIGDR
jgi:peroxiredoxin